MRLLFKVNCQFFGTNIAHSQCVCHLKYLVFIGNTEAQQCCPSSGILGYLCLRPSCFDSFMRANFAKVDVRNKRSRVCTFLGHPMVRKQFYQGLSLEDLLLCKFSKAVWYVLRLLFKVNCQFFGTNFAHSQCVCHLKYLVFIYNTEAQQCCPSSGILGYLCLRTSCFDSFMRANFAKVDVRKKRSRVCTFLGHPMVRKQFYQGLSLEDRLLCKFSKAVWYVLRLLFKVNCQFFWHQFCTQPVCMSSQMFGIHT